MGEIFYNYINSMGLYSIILITVISLLILSKGADILVEEAISLSIHWGISKLLIGATIISLGTTLPEVAVSVMAAIEGNPDLAIGNAVGSVIANTGLILGSASLIGALPVDKFTLNNQGKVFLQASILLGIIVSLPFLLRTQLIIHQKTGFLLLILLFLYLHKSLVWAKSGEKVITEEIEEEKTSIIIQLLKLALGTSLIILSSKILVISVEIGALRVGIPQGVIAATLVAFGTSLPELVTAISAVKKGHGELAVGNVIGANILNILFVIGASASVTSQGLTITNEFYRLQLPTMLILVLILRYFSKQKGNNISKLNGLILLAIYSIYMLLNYI